MKNESKQSSQPISKVEWVPIDDIQANSYNPNNQAPPERKLLKISIMEDGWTQPIVCFDNGKELTIVDGEHRWKTAHDPELLRMFGGKVPIVRIKKSESERMFSTVRHNRARGSHDITQMGVIVRQLLEAGSTPEQVRDLLQMEDEEVERLAEIAGMPEVICESKGDKFGTAWVPE